jgi:basic membrane protein A
VTAIDPIDATGLSQLSVAGAQNGADDIGADRPTVIVPSNPRDYGPDIGALVSQGDNIIVTVGSDLAGDTIKAAKANPNIWFIGVDQAPMCVDAQGVPDASFTCVGDPAAVAPHLIAIRFEEDQAGYLTGIVAAGITRTKRVGAIGGSARIPRDVRYMQGYVLGAKSVNPTITVDVGYISTDTLALASNTVTTVRQYATKFINQTGDDVVFQVAGKIGDGILQAACAARVYGIGVDIDQYQSLGAAKDPTYGCVVTSAETHVSSAVEILIRQIQAGVPTDYNRAGAAPMAVAHAGNVTYNVANSGVGISAFTPSSAIPTDIQAKVRAALQTMQTGTLVTCPSKCGFP